MQNQIAAVREEQRVGRLARARPSRVHRAYETEGGDEIVRDAIGFMLKTNLQDLATAQTAYFTAHGSYADKLSDLGFSPDLERTVRIQAADENGWRAWARYKTDDRIYKTSGGTGPAAGESPVEEQQ